MENKLIVIENDVCSLTPETAEVIAGFEKAMKQIKSQYDEIKANILAEMEANNIKKIVDNVNGVSITFTESYEKETFNSKKLREDNPDLYDSYISFSTVKPSIRIKVQ